MYRVALVALVLFLAADPAAAGGTGGVSNTGGTTTEITGSTATVTAGHISERVITSGPGARPGRVITCQWWEIQGLSFHDTNPDPVTPTDGGIYELRCFENGTMLAGYPLITAFTPTIRIDPIVTTRNIAEFAAQSITFEPPTPALSPPGDQIVGIPTWLAVTSRLDYPSASAAAGPVWATIRPQLRHTTFTMPNGDTITCTPDTDLTTLWNPALGANQTSQCTYTLTSNSTTNTPNEPAHTTITITTTWDLYQRTNLNPTEHYFRPHTETTIHPITIRELQAVIN